MSGGQLQRGEACRDRRRGGGLIKGRDNEGVQEQRREEGEEMGRRRREGKKGEKG